MRRYDILNTIGNTPLISIDGVLAKLESANPTGSIKDRLAWFLVRKAEGCGVLKPGMEIIEATSGNTGVALAMISSLRNYQLTAIMPEAKDDKWQRMMEKHSAKVIVTPAKLGIAGTLKLYKKITARKRGIWLPRQFENPANIEAHRRHLGKEILKGVRGEIDAFVAGVGTGGTIIGVARALKKHDPNIRIIVIEPAESRVLSGGKSGLHAICGIGAGFIPELLKRNINLIDDVITVRADDAQAAANRLFKQHGLQVGTSSGANMWAAEKLKARYKTIVTVFPDRG